MNLGELLIQPVEQLLLSLGLAHQRRHLFLQMADYVRVDLGRPRPLHELVDLASPSPRCPKTHRAGACKLEPVEDQNGELVIWRATSSHPTVAGLLGDVVQVREQVILFLLEQLHAQRPSRCLPDRLVVE